MIALVLTFAVVALALVPAAILLVRLRHRRRGPATETLIRSNVISLAEYRACRTRRILAGEPPRPGRRSHGTHGSPARGKAAHPSSHHG